MIKYKSIPAIYRPTRVGRYDGNPFIEALPPLEDSADAILDRLKNYPQKSTNADRKKGEMQRGAEVARIKDIVHPFAHYKGAGKALTYAVRESYVARNPIHPEDIRHRTHIAAALDKSAHPGFPDDWKSSATGQTLLGISGSGKTTFASAFSLPYQVVIEHKSYRGRPLVCRQIPWINLRMPHDATLKSLCLQFFEVVDGILENTNYLRQARAERSIARMVPLIAQVATAASVGVIFIDEVQNLRAATGANAEVVLNLFTDIIERAGVSLVIAGTPALEPVLRENVRNIRKLNLAGGTTFAQMKFGDPEFDAFCDLYWEYQFVKKPARLNGTIRKAWYEAGGGNPAFTSLAFMLAQQKEIGSREVIDELSFQRVSNTEMAILRPAISALLSGKDGDLRKFDDLLFKSGCAELRKLIAWSDGAGASPTYDEEEFDDLGRAAQIAPRKKPERTNKKKLSPQLDFAELPMEDPLTRRSTNRA